MAKLLAPAGTKDALIAAIQSGADEVYLGLSSFNARAGAENFTVETLAPWVKYAHVRGVKIHVTMNILLSDEELDAAEKLAVAADNIGVDAFIVQDVGLAMRLAGKVKAALHASTQMTVYNVEGVRRLRDLGFSRVVLSRELPLTEIKKIVDANIMETEVFCHGALCMSYSGQCMLSFAAGKGRSGNRGTCSQPCRLKYKSGDNDWQNLLSPADLCSLSYLDKLVATGVTSLKIEGRLKSPEYVAAVTRNYRSVTDNLALFDSTSAKAGSSATAGAIAMVDSSATVGSSTKVGSSATVGSSASSGDPATVGSSATLNSYLLSLNSKIDELQVVFSRGGFSSGHQLGKMPVSAVTKDYAGRTGLYIGKSRGRGKTLEGKIQSFRLPVYLEKPLNVGDGISFYGYPDFGGIINKIDQIDSFSASILVCGKLPPVSGELFIYKTLDVNLSKTLEQYKNPDLFLKKVPISGKFEILENKAVLKFFDSDANVSEASCDVVLDSDRSLKEADILGIVTATGNTPFVVTGCDCVLGDKSAFVPFSELKKLRRNAVEKLTILREERR